MPFFSSTVRDCTLKVSVRKQPHERRSAMRSLNKLILMLCAAAMLATSFDVNAQETCGVPSAPAVAAEETPCDLKVARAKCEENARTANARGYFRLETGQKFKRILWDVAEAFEEGVPKGLPTIVVREGEDEVQTNFLHSLGYYASSEETLSVPMCNKLTACDQEPETKDQPLGVFMKGPGTWPELAAATMMNGFAEPQTSSTHAYWSWDFLSSYRLGLDSRLRRHLHRLTMDEVPFSQAMRWTTDRVGVVWKILPDAWQTEYTYRLAEFMGTALDLDAKEIYARLGETASTYRKAVKDW